ncbi:MAG: divalent cation tolerance protein CutA [Chitinivibrionales bacterium]|nr:divalent cation tolerance protein CutA [Chitinivibrionales bacterium]
MADNSICMVYITTKDKAEARAVGKVLVEEHYAACANIIDGMHSLFFWEGVLEDDSETVLIVKTQTCLVDKLTERVKTIHSYDVPCVVALPITGGNPDYIQWVCKETAAAL